LVAWEKVQRPLQYGGLGIHNLELLGWALRIRWLWVQKTDVERPWAGLSISIPYEAWVVFNMAVNAVVGNGEKILFWSDHWMDGLTMAEMAPNLFRAVPKRTVQVLFEYLQVWDFVEEVVLQPDAPDQFRWKLTQDGCYSSKSVYEAFFVGSMPLPSLALGRESGKPGLRRVVSSLYNWCIITGFGPLIVLSGGTCPIQSLVHFVTRWMRRCITC
jgi:hypothetical protein